MAKFTLGDGVRVAADAPANVRPGSPAEVVGVSEQRERHGSYLHAFPSGSFTPSSLRMEAMQKYTKITSSLWRRTTIRSSFR